MGIDIVGRDINPFIARGARENIAHFGLQGEVVLGAIENVTDAYDVALVDMPYNLFSTTTPEEQRSIIQHARRIASKVIIITIETIDDMIIDAGFTITDRCVAKKGQFSRQILVCTYPSVKTIKKTPVVRCFFDSLGCRFQTRYTVAKYSSS